MTTTKNLRGALATLACALVATAALATPAQADFKILEFDGSTLNQDGSGATQAGAHPFEATTGFRFTQSVDSNGAAVPEENVRSIVVDLPLGFVGNPTSTAKCTEDQLVENATVLPFTPNCPIDSQVGFTELAFTLGGSTATVLKLPVYNMVTPPGKPALLGFNPILLPIRASAAVLPDQRIRVVVKDVSQATPLVGASMTLWGVPADPAHDPERHQVCYDVNDDGDYEDVGSGDTCLSGNVPSPGERIPFLSNPTDCAAGPLATTIAVDTYQDPLNPEGASFLSHLPDGTPSGVTGCEKLTFAPRVSARPTSTQADSPTGLDVSIAAPTDGLLNPDGIAESHLKKAVVTLPEGMSVNPSSANGLGSCSPAQIGLGSSDPATCPDQSKVGTVSIHTPLLESPLAGSIYLAKQNDNPFNSLLALYLVVENEERGVRVKLAGKVDPDPTTGRLVTTFDDNPQLPFSQLEVNLKSGARAPLITPRECGRYSIESDLYPWARPNDPVHTSSSFEVRSGPDGKPCPTPGSFDPSFEAGTLTPIGGAYSPLLVNASRPDGSGPLTGLKLDLPQGLLGKLAGIPYCPEAALAAAAGKSGQSEQSSASCPAASKVGTVDVGAGAGSTPFHVQGTAYLAGPYKGAPLSIATITPAVAGPFDLGTVVVRAKADVNPATAEITVNSDPIPQILQGIPLKVRSVSVNASRPEFTLNPTDCNPMSFAGTLFSPSASKAVSSRFQVGACKALDFEPKLALKLSGKTNRSAHPALKATLTMPPGGANIARAQVTLPKTEFLEQSHIRTVCTRVQFAAKACPKASIYGYAKAWSPLLDKPLEGPVYLRSSNNELPDLVASLDGQIHVDLSGRIDSVNARIRNTFELVPDAPVSKFVLTMQGGKKGLLVNNTELCRAKPRADVKFDGQNGKVADSRPLVRVDCGKKGKKRKK